MKFQLIHYNGKEYPAVCCPRCRGKVYPVDKLEGHLDMHLVKDLQCKPNKEQQAFARATREKWR